MGLLLIPRLLKDERVGKVVALDAQAPEQRHPKLTYRRLDLTHHEAEATLRSCLKEEGVEILFHLAFLSAPMRSASFTQELEVVGAMQVLAAVPGTAVRRLLVPSLTALYGARGERPALLDEKTQLFGCRESRFISDKVKVEQKLRAFVEAHPAIEVTILRFAPVVGPSVNNPITRFLRRSFVPTLLGFDPLWQAVHEDDAARALHLAMHASAQGAFNVVGGGVLPLSAMIFQAGGRAIPLAKPVAAAALGVLAATGGVQVPVEILDYLHYSWVADGGRAQRELGFVPHYHAREAVETLRRGA